MVAYSKLGIVLCLNYQIKGGDSWQEQLKAVSAALKNKTSICNAPRKSRNGLNERMCKFMFSMKKKISGLLVLSFLFSICMPTFAAAESDNLILPATPAIKTDSGNLIAPDQYNWENNGKDATIQPNATTTQEQTAQEDIDEEREAQFVPAIAIGGYKLTVWGGAALLGAGAIYFSRSKGEDFRTKDKRRGSENRQKTYERERNVGHPKGEEHSRVPKGPRGRR